MEGRTASGWPTSRELIGLVKTSAFMRINPVVIRQNVIRRKPLVMRTFKPIKRPSLVRVLRMEQC